jgi:serine/threonine-protein kinase HipA
MNNARVNLWGRMIGAVSWVNERDAAVFQYDPGFVNSGVELSPLMMPLNLYPYEFPALPRETFRGLPGLLADSLPDKFGNALIDAWLAEQGRAISSFNPVERLCYIGSRGMGALEFEPALSGPVLDLKESEIEISSLVALSNRVLNQRENLKGAFSGEDDRKSIGDILRVGTSAGGARAKAILAWDPVSGKFLSGQVTAPAGFEYWIVKFDGISNNRDKELADPQGFGKIEYAYYLMAQKAGIIMPECRLLHEGGRNHFMARRFDRNMNGTKIHMQSLGALAHADFNNPTGFSYEQALQVMKKLELPMDDVEQQVIRGFFNTTARNLDDHVKNTAFLMDRQGRWRLSPAFDVTYAYNPDGLWTGKHQMSINGKREAIVASDLISMAGAGGIKSARAMQILESVSQCVALWPEFASLAGVPEETMRQIQFTHLTNLLK